MSKKVFGTVLKVVGIVTLAVVTAGTAIVVGAGAGFGFAAASFGTLALAGVTALNISNGLLTASKAQKAAASARAEQIRAMVNPQAAANWVFGETATAIQIVYSETFGSKKDSAALVYAGPAHEVDSYGQLYINDEAVSFSGTAATGAWSGAVSRYTNPGTESQGALSIPGSLWPVTARGRGFAHFALKWSLDHDKVKDGLPDRITQVVKGAPVYDPRLDSTVGGSGTQRADDQTTWAYSNSISPNAGANWALIVLHYILGWHNNGKLVYGRAADTQDIDYASFITAANVCDQIVDGIPRYHIGGIERIDGDHARVIASLEATIGGKISKAGGIYHIWAPYDDLVAVETITEGDLIREAGVNFQDARSLENIYNVGQGQFIDPAALYQPAPYPEVREEDAITDLGRERIMSYDTPFIQDEKRSQRIVLQQIRRSLFGRVWQLAVGPKYFRRKVFDVLNLNIKETNFTDTLVRVTEKTISPDGLISFTLEEENALIYDVTAPLGTAATRNIPATFDAATKLPVTTLDVAPITVTGTGGTASDALQVSYDDPGPLVNRTDIEFQISGATDWQPAASKVLDAGVAIISPVESGTTYFVRVRHWTVFNVKSDWVTDFTVAGQASVIDYGNVANGPPAGATVGPGTLHLLTPDGDIKLSGNNAERVVGPQGWDAHFYSTNSYTGGCYIEFKTNTPTLDAMLGLAQSPLASEHYNTIDHVWYVPATGVGLVYELGTQQGGNHDTITTNTIFRIEYNNKDITYLIDGVVKHVTANVGTGLTFFLDASMFKVGSTFTNINFGPFANGVHDTNQLADGANLGGTADWSGVADDGGRPEYYATRGDPFGASFNLLGSDAGPEHSFTTASYNYINMVPLVDLGLVVGDVISFSGDLKTDGTPGESARLGISTFDAAGGFVSAATATPTVPGTTYTRSQVTVTIPAGSVKLLIWTTWLFGSTGTKFVKKAMLNRGPVALPYVAPYADGATDNSVTIDINGRVINQTFLPNLLAGGAGSVFSVRPIASSTDAGTTATINISASTLRYGSIFVNYPSGAITGLNFSTTYHVYGDDPNYSGSLTGGYIATTNFLDLALADGRVFFGSFTTLANGGATGGTGGDPPPDIGQCVAVEMWITDYQAKDSEAGRDILILDEDANGYAPGAIDGVDFGTVPCVEIKTLSGCRLVCSETTPITLRDGTTILAPDSLGVDVAVLNDGFRWEEITSVKGVGPRRVAHIHIGGRTYGAGDVPDKLIFTHNVFKQ